jgi:hypothetical protein
MILLVFNWVIGVRRNDFLSSAMQRKPGLDITVLIGFHMVLDLEVLLLNERIYLLDIAQYRNLSGRMVEYIRRNINRTFSYTISPIVGKEHSSHLLKADHSSINVEIPKNEVDIIGMYFNRAVVSSQVFSKKSRK